MTEHFDLAVIGSGGAGTMAFLRGVLNRDRCVLFSGDATTKRKGRAMWVVEVDNVPGMHDLKRPITSTTKSTLAWLEAHPELASHASHKKAAVTTLEAIEGGFRLGYASKQETGSLTASFVVNATGIMDVQPEIAGSIKPILPFANRYDVLYCIRCDGHKTIGKRLSVIGAGNAAVHIAAMLCERYGHEAVPILTNGLEASFSDSTLELAAAYGMQIHQAPLVEVLGNARKEGLQGYLLEDGSRVETDCTIVSLGIVPYNQLLLQVGAAVDPKGRAQVSDQYETSVPGLFVVGDLVSGHKMQIYTAWDEAVDAADEINLRLRMRLREQRLQSYRAQ